MCKNQTHGLSTTPLRNIIFGILWHIREEGGDWAIALPFGLYFIIILFKNYFP